MQLIGWVILFLFILPKKAFAYLDPGTGSYFIQIILALLFGGIITLKSYARGIKEFIKQRLTKSKDEQKSNQ